ncbi:BORG1 protein, partial [Polyodon spathula]|nr:cdc42 effector protein 2-like [Polyodon spathula]XP_041092153.1 cdc42 effector protein 2-like [Polyodon spathula]XP_041092154.1 cdc42 effector protein 2-like [Polyodon spathula]MBN3284454.1 BORG1 protein [Polyodon spathula]
MPAKIPIYLKTSTPKQGKKLKLRDVLSGDMISPPLGDFRHSAHVGPAGEEDMFGDVSFMKGKLDLLPETGRRASEEAAQGRTLRDGFPARKKNHSGSLLKSAVSLPAFGQEQPPPKPPRLHLGDCPGQRCMSVSHSAETGVCFRGDEELSYPAGFGHLLASSGSLSESSSSGSEEMGAGCSRYGPLGPSRGLSLDSDAGLSNEDLLSEIREPAGVPKSESVFGMDLDLGPSILEDVLRIMDAYKLRDGQREL